MSDLDWTIRRLFAERAIVITTFHRVVFVELEAEAGRSRLYRSWLLTGLAMISPRDSVVLRV